MEKIKNIKLTGSDLASRSVARSVRLDLISSFDEDTKIIFDFTEVKSLSASYADELFGVLVKTFGYEQVLSSVRIRDAKRPILLTIADVIERRRNEMASVAA